MVAAGFAPEPVSWDDLRALHDANIRQHIYLLVMFYLCVYGVSVMTPRIKSYSSKVICCKHIFASVILIVCCTIIFLSFCFFKNTIPYINPYSWDDALIKLDRLLLFNHDAWFLIKTKTEMIIAYDYIYLSWIPITSTMLFWQQVSVDRSLRLQYLASVLAAWLVLGCWCAVIFASVGPCFYEFFYSNVPDAIYAINSHIGPLGQELGLLTSAAKHALIDNYRGEDFTIGYGISAFPSLHIATTVINALTIQKRFPRLKIVVWVYALLLSVSCIYLGFHYFSDCIFGAMGALVIWIFIENLLAKQSV